MTKCPDCPRLPARMFLSVPKLTTPKKHPKATANRGTVKFAGVSPQHHAKSMAGLDKHRQAFSRFHRFKSRWWSGMSSVLFEYKTSEDALGNQQTWLVTKAMSRRHSPQRHSRPTLTPWKSRRVQQKQPMAKTSRCARNDTKNRRWHSWSVKCREAQNFLEIAGQQLPTLTAIAVSPNSVKALCAHTKGESLFMY